LARLVSQDANENDAREALSAVLLLLKRNLASSLTGTVDFQPYIALSEHVGQLSPPDLEAPEQSDKQTQLRIDEAITLYEQTLADRARELGPDHPDTLTSRTNLASA
jgi:hypothetical protein